MEQACTCNPCRLVFGGDGPLRSHLEQYISDHHLEDHVVFANQQINPYPHICRADLLALLNEL